MESLKSNSNCRSCSASDGIVTDTPHIYMGNNFDGTVVIGESPHKSWKESGSPFLNKNQKMTPSGKRILEYLEILGKSKDNIVLLESARCVVKDRKNLKKAINNCQKNLLKDINNLKPRLVISFGKLVADSLSGVWEKQFEPCNIYSINGFIFVPLYHPSPINPTNHAKNLKFLIANKKLIKP